MCDKSQCESGKKVLYVLRRTLPPWSFQDNLNELIDCLPRYGVDEVVVKVDVEDFTHGQPAIGWVKRYQKNLFRIKETLDGLGIGFSINPWISIGHGDMGRDATKQLHGLQALVGHDGTRAKVCACPLCPVWRKHIKRIWTIYAQTQPKVIWVEDDFRLHNHCPVDFSCFCPLHLKRFSEKIGRKVTRQEVVKAMLKPGKPHSWRTKYMDMQAEVMNETMAYLSHVVHKISAQTCVGLMHGGPYLHASETRRWKRASQVLADGGPFYSRPHLGSYSETALREIRQAPQLLLLARHVMADSTIHQAEIENYPASRFSKSTTYTFLQMAVALVSGCHAVMMNLFDHAGTPMEEEPEWGQMLSKKKPFLASLARVARQPGTYRGVQLLFREDYVQHKWLKKGEGYESLHQFCDPIGPALSALGIPITFDESRVVACWGQMIRAYTDQEILGMLGKDRGLLLDAVAAGVLLERGFGPYIGLKDIDKPRPVDEYGVAAQEEFHNGSFGGSDGKYLKLWMPREDRRASRPMFGKLGLVRGAHVVSNVVDPDAKRHQPAMIAYENKLGGRTAISAMDMRYTISRPFYEPHRRDQYQGIVRWLSGNAVPALVQGDGVYPLVLVKDTGGEILIGFFNLTLDSWPGFEIELAQRRKANKILVLSPTGRWTESKAVHATSRSGRTILSYSKPVRHEIPVFIRLKFSCT